MKRSNTQKKKNASKRVKNWIDDGGVDDLTQGRRGIWASLNDSAEDENTSSSENPKAYSSTEADTNKNDVLLIDSKGLNSNEVGVESHTTSTSRCNQQNQTKKANDGTKIDRSSGNDHDDNDNKLSDTHFEPHQEEKKILDCKNNKDTNSCKGCRSDNDESDDDEQQEYKNLNSFDIDDDFSDDDNSSTSSDTPLVDTEDEPENNNNTRRDKRRNARRDLLLARSKLPTCMQISRRLSYRLGKYSPNTHSPLNRSRVELDYTPNTVENDNVSHMSTKHSF